MIPFNSVSLKNNKDTGYLRYTMVTHSGIQHYDKIRHEVKEQELKNQVSFTLITKILMGTLGCVPAYDRYFIAGIKNQKVATGNYNLKSILQLVDFYDKNADRLECVREKMEVAGMPYPQMKIGILAGRI